MQLSIVMNQKGHGVVDENGLVIRTLATRQEAEDFIKACVAPKASRN